MMSHSSNKTEDDSRHSLRKLHAEFKAKRKLRIPEEIQKIQKEFCKTYRLFQAVELNNVEKVKNLLQQGVSANSTDFELRSVLHVAVSKGYADIVELLLKYGADPNKKDMIHNTPLHLAVCLHNISIISMLINANADVSSLDNNGRTAFQLASSKLKLLQSSWRAGTIEMIKLREEMKQVVDLLLSILMRGIEEKMEKMNSSDVDDLQMMKLSLNSGPDEAVEEQIANLLEEIEKL